MAAGRTRTFAALCRTRLSGQRRMLIFFFSSRRRHTRFDCDWSSDVCSSDLEKHANFSSDPDWPNQQINRSLKKRRTISFHPVSEKQKHPPPKKQCRSPNPLQEKHKDNPRKNHGDTDGMQELV